MQHVNYTLLKSIVHLEWFYSPMFSTDVSLSFITSWQGSIFSVQVLLLTICVFITSGPIVIIWVQGYSGQIRGTPQHINLVYCLV